MADKIFAQGISFYQPSPKAPKWVIGKICVNADKFCDFIKQQESVRGWVSLDVKISQKTNEPYIEVNTYKPQTKS